MEYSRFFNSTTDDRRVYTADDFAEVMSAFYSSGVVGKGLAVNKTGSNTITISPGEAIIEGYYYNNTDDIVLTLTGSNVKAIVLFLDKSNAERNIKVTQIDGEPPQPGYIDTQKEKFYLPIAAVSMKSGNEIDGISDRRTYCDGLFSVDLTEFRQQAADAVKEIKTMSADAIEDILSTAGGLPIESGGTGATDAESALANLGAASEIHTHSAYDIDQGVLSIECGGTGATTITEAQATLGMPTTHICTTLSANTSTVINKRYYTDFDTMVDAGIYYIPVVNTDYSLMADFEVLNGWLIVIPNKVAPATCVKQIFLRLGTANTNDHMVFVRTYIANSWSTWARFYTTKDTLPIANGGTGATSASVARTNLGAAAASHTHSANSITSGTLNIVRGGTGASTASAAFKALSEDTGWLTAPIGGQYWINGAQTSTGTSLPPVKYRKVGRQVFIDGFFKGTAAVNSLDSTNQKILFTLPDGYHPHGQIYFRLPMSGRDYAKAFITTAGAVGLDLTTSDASTFSNLWFNFNNVSFFVD